MMKTVKDFKEHWNRLLKYLLLFEQNKYAENRVAQVLNILTMSTDIIISWFTKWPFEYIES